MTLDPKTVKEIYLIGGGILRVSPGSFAFTTMDIGREKQVTVATFTEGRYKHYYMPVDRIASYVCEVGKPEKGKVGP